MAEIPANTGKLAPTPGKVAKLLRLIKGRERFAVFLLVTLFIGALTESFGLSLILPLLNSLMGLGDTGQGRLMAILGDLLALLPEEGRIESLLVIFAIAFFLKGALMVLNRGLNLLFAHRLRQDWASRLLQHYLLAEYRNLDSLPQGVMIQNVIQETQIGAKVMTHIIDFVNKLILSALLFLVLLMVHWQATLVIGVIAAVVLTLIRRSIGQYSIRFGRIRLKLGRRISVLATESLQNVRQIKLFGAYQQRHLQFLEYLREYARVAAFFQAIAEIPKQTTELSVIILVAGALIWVRQVAGGDMQSAAAMLGFFIVVSQRLISNIAYLTSRRMIIGASLPSLHLIYELLEDAPNREDLETGLTFEGLETDLVFRDIAFSYADGRVVLDGVDLTIQKGRTTALVGPSGGGKTTLMDILIGFRKPQRGEILLNGHAITDYSLASLRQRIGYLTQEPEIFNTTVLENIRMGWPAATDGACIAAAKMAHADEFITRLPQQYGTELGDRGNALSVGQRQRLALARVILRQPDIFIFDEPTSALDEESERLVRQSVQALEGRATVIMIAHRLSTIRHADAIYRVGKTIEKIELADVEEQ